MDLRSFRILVRTNGRPSNTDQRVYTNLFSPRKLVSTSQIERASSKAFEDPTDVRKSDHLRVQGAPRGEGSGDGQDPLKPSGAKHKASETSRKGSIYGIDYVVTYTVCTGLKHSNCTGFRQLLFIVTLNGYAHRRRRIFG